MAKSQTIPFEDLPSIYLSGETEVDLTEQFEKPMKSSFVNVDSVKYWRARHHQTGIYFTPNEKDPKILNTSIDRCRGSRNFSTGETARKHGGRKKGSKNFQTVNSICGNLGVHPAEFLAGVMSGDTKILSKYRVKDKHNITIAHKIKCAQILEDKLEGTAKSVERDAEGNVISVNGQGDDKKTLQVFLEAPKQEIKKVQEEGFEVYMERSENEYDESFDI